ncbi:MAG: hypothetical protein VR77_10700 [Flavobacteriales bacterium BRH_c54]|nr:MAG: hypothetical protein VR77_10700 [Flavobacteriales bacterium BRH_c54]
MSNNKTVFYVIGAVAGLVIIWLVLDRMEKNLKITELDKKNKEKDDINKKLQETIEESTEIPLEVKKQLEKLIQQYQNVDNDVTQELMSASSLIEIKEFSKAIGVLTKIIENLLKEKYSSDTVLINKAKKKGRKAPALVDFIEHARDEKFITPEEFHFANGLRELRNGDAHILNPKKTKMLTSSAFLSAVDLILKISAKVLGLRKTAPTY